MAANARLTEKLATFDHLMQENILLRQAANVVPSLGERKFVSARVLTSPLRGWELTFLIGAGASSGLSKGQPVVCLRG